MKDNEILKKIFLLGVGAVGVGVNSLNKEKIEKAINDFLDKNEKTQEEGKKIVDELLQKSKDTREDFEKKVEDSMKKVFERAHIATTEDIKRLEERIKALEARLGQS